VPKPKYESKGRHKVNIIYYFSTSLNKNRQMIDVRHYNTDNEKDTYIAQSINSYRKLANAYHTQIVGLKVDTKFWNINRLAEVLS